MAIRTVNLSTPDIIIEFVQKHKSPELLNGTTTPKVNEFVKKILNMVTSSFGNYLVSCEIDKFFSCTEPDKCLVNCKEFPNSPLSVIINKNFVMRTDYTSQHPFLFMIRKSGDYYTIMSSLKGINTNPQEIHISLQESGFSFVEETANSGKKNFQATEDPDVILQDFETYIKNVKNHFPDKPAEPPEAENSQTGLLLGGLGLAAAVGTGVLYARHKSRQKAVNEPAPKQGLQTGR